MSRIHVVVAMGTNRGIGMNGSIPWKSKLDMQHFKMLTSNKIQNPKTKALMPPVVIMGRNTWYSIPNAPLKNRINIIVSSQISEALSNNMFSFPPNDKTFATTSLDGALDISQKMGCEDPWVIGGSKLYEDALNHECMDTLHMTLVDGDFKCDTFFPEIPEQVNNTVTSKAYEENGRKLYFITMLHDNSTTDVTKM